MLYKNVQDKGTLERVLVDEGVISQQIYGYTFVTSQTKSVTIGANTFRFRTLVDRFLCHPQYTIDTHALIDWKTVKDI